MKNNDPDKKGKDVKKSSISNLRPIQKGEVRNPYGKRGKSGFGGFSLKNNLKCFLSMLTPTQRNNFFNGLYTKATEGDVQAIKLMAELNDEMQSVTIDGSLGCVILPAKAPKIVDEDKPEDKKE